MWPLLVTFLSFLQNWYTFFTVTIFWGKVFWKKKHFSHLPLCIFSWMFIDDIRVCMCEQEICKYWNPFIGGLLSKPNNSLGKVTHHKKRGSKKVPNAFGRGFNHFCINIVDHDLKFNILQRITDSLLKEHTQIWDNFWQLKAVY